MGVDLPLAAVAIFFGLSVCCKENVTSYHLASMIKCLLLVKHQTLEADYVSLDLWIPPFNDYSLHSDASVSSI